MNRLYIALLMLLVSGIICGCEIYTVNESVNSFTKGLEDVKALNESERFEEAGILSNEILKSWKTTSRKLDKYLYHDYIDNITEEMSALPVYASNSDNEAARALIEEIKIQLTSLKESELPYMHNIL